MDKIPKSKAIKLIVEKINSRKIYEDAIMNCVTGNIILYSCGKNETSNDDIVLGGYFSYSLLQYCETWVREQKSSNILNIKEAFDQTKRYLNLYLTTNQNPEISPQIRSNWYPFAISKNSIINFLGL